LEASGGPGERLKSKKEESKPGVDDNWPIGMAAIDNLIMKSLSHFMERERERGSRGFRRASAVDSGVSYRSRPRGSAKEAEFINFDNRAKRPIGTAD